jgi:hypothetical protein
MAEPSPLDAELARLHERIAELEQRRIPIGLSPAKHLHAEAEARGVTTQWLKDLGYTLTDATFAGERTYTLEPPLITADLEQAARDALAEIMAVAKIIQDDHGTRLQIPTDSWMWVAKAMQEWAT